MQVSVDPCATDPRGSVYENICVEAPTEVSWPQFCFSQPEYMRNMPHV